MRFYTVVGLGCEEPRRPGQRPSPHLALILHRAVPISSHPGPSWTRCGPRLAIGRPRTRLAVPMARGAPGDIDHDLLAVTAFRPGPSSSVPTLRRLACSNSTQTKRGVRVDLHGKNLATTLCNVRNQVPSRVRRQLAPQSEPLFP